MGESILEYLRVHANGRHNAVKSYELRELFGCDAGALRGMVNNMRRSGEPICSSKTGYFYASNRAEVDETIEQLSHRISGIQGAINGLQIGSQSRFSD